MRIAAAEQCIVRFERWRRAPRTQQSDWRSAQAGGGCRVQLPCRRQIVISDVTVAIAKPHHIQPEIVEHGLIQRGPLGVRHDLALTVRNRGTESDELLMLYAQIDAYTGRGPGYGCAHSGDAHLTGRASVRVARVHAQARRWDRAPAALGDHASVTRADAGSPGHVVAAAPGGAHARAHAAQALETTAL